MIPDIIIAYSIAMLLAIYYIFITICNVICKKYLINSKNTLIIKISCLLIIQLLLILRFSMKFNFSTIKSLVLINLLCFTLHIILYLIWNLWKLTKPKLKIKSINNFYGHIKFYWLRYSIVSFVLGIVLYNLIPTYYMYYKKYNGYCAKENRYLTDKEKMDRVVSKIFNNQYQIIPYYQVQENGDWIDKKAKSKVPLNSEGEHPLLYYSDYFLQGSGTNINEAFELDKSIKYFYKPILKLENYKNIEDFYIKNPNCCEFSKDTNSFYARKFGVNDRNILVKHNISYIEEDGKKQKILYEFHYIITNCANTLGTESDIEANNN